MWFRGVAASMGLCFDLGAVLEGYRKKLGEEGYRKTCEENALPVDFEKMSYPDFLEQRRKLMAGIVKKAYLKLCE